MTVFSLCRRFVVSGLVRTMASSKHTYEEAIHKLNNLQSNKSSLEQIRKDIKTGRRCTNLEDMENYLMRTGITLAKLDELSIIHVAGTKGKGSTSAMCESILRSHGFRTGLYTSPHLVAVRERIRLNGAVVAKDKFGRHFHRVYRLLEKSQAHEGDMPKYFAFLTVLAYSMFLEEKVEVAIVEVGIGGVVDFTNVVRRVPVVGITSLGLDHTSILGNTIEEIAAAKAGIMKPGCEAYTVQQPPGAMRVLRTHAAHVQCPLTVVPDYEAYSFHHQPRLPVRLDAYKTNASLAVQLAHAWLRLAKCAARPVLKKQIVSGKIMQDFIEIDPYIVENGKDVIQDVVTHVPVETALGLERCHWPGRFQVVRADYATFYLDGAHTKESVEICSQWFEDNNRHQEKILIFSATGDRDAEVLLKQLRNINFSTVYFVIPTAYKNLSEKNDNYSLMEQKDLINRCQKHAEIWRELHNDPKPHINVLDCVSDALVQIKRKNSVVQPKSILITGSLHLVGAALSILDPNLSKD